MRREYDFGRARRTPYADRLKKPVTTRLDEETLAYFPELATKTGAPYQTLINMYLRDCAERRRRPRWEDPSRAK